MVINAFLTTEVLRASNSENKGFLNSGPGVTRHEVWNHYFLGQKTELRGQVFHLLTVSIFFNSNFVGSKQGAYESFVQGVLFFDGGVEGRGSQGANNEYMRVDRVRSAFF